MDVLQKPPDIPTNPNHIYAHDGWAGMGDWLGTGTIAFPLIPYRSFKKARAFVQGLGLKSVTEWRDYCKSGKKPPDIPNHAARTYAEAGWTDWGDWLGTGTVAPGSIPYRSFKDARAFARGLKLKSVNDWRDYCKSGKKPDDIPNAPDWTYAEAGWTEWGDWLGTRRVPPGRHRSFKKARAFVRGLKLKSVAEWRDYCKSGKKPPDIPTNPNHTYANDGWAGISDWLGTGKRRPGTGWRSFRDARAYVGKLGLKSRAEWNDYCKSGKKPPDIPDSPNFIYANDGWAGISDWLGTGRVAPGQYRTFKKARAFVRGLGLKSRNEWSGYCKSGKKPADIPYAPQIVYANDGWAGTRDWLGIGSVANRLRAA
jgi:ribosomal protein L30/L7E